MTKIHWMMAWFKETDMKLVNFAKRLLRKPIFESTNVLLGSTDGDNYIIENVCVSGYTVNDKKNEKTGYNEDKGAVFFYFDSGLIQLGKSYYPSVRFSVPKSQLVKWETEEENFPQTITITKWAHNNCVVPSYNRILEDWGCMIKALFRAYETEEWDNLPMYLSNPYRNIIEKIKLQNVSDTVREWKKKNKDIFIENKDNNKPKVVLTEHGETDIRKEAKPIVSDNNKNNRNTNAIKKGKKNNHKKVEPFRKDAEWVFYTDGSGNLAKDKRTKDKGHYNIYLQNTKERWKKKEVRITNNEAEIKSVIAAIYIGLERDYKKIEVRTDSQNTIKWCHGRDFEFITNIKKTSTNTWNTNKPKIAELIDRLVELGSKVEHLKINYISRKKNFAHSF